jgi:hypothetical protein
VYLIGRATDSIWECCSIGDDLVGVRITTSLDRPAIINWEVLVTRGDVAVKRTVYIFVPDIFETEVNYLIGSSEDLLLGDITVVRIPRVPSQCRQSPLNLPISKREARSKLSFQWELTTPSGRTREDTVGARSTTEERIASDIVYSLDSITISYP